LIVRETAVVADVDPGLGASLARTTFRAKDTLWRFYLAPLKQASGSLKSPARDRQALVVASHKQVRSQLGQVTVLAYDANGYGRGAFLNNRTIIRGRHPGRGVFGQAVVRYVKAAHSFISLIGGAARVRLACAPGIRQRFVADAQSISGPRIHPKGIQVVDVIVDGQFDTPQNSRSRPEPGY